MDRRPGLSRRSFVARVTGGVVVVGSPLAVVFEQARAFQTPRGCSDSDPTDPLGNGRTCTPPGPATGCTDRDPTDPSGRGRNCTSTTPTDTTGTTGCSDSDPTDPSGRGRNCRAAGPQTGCTDSDTGASYDRVSYGRNCTAQATQIRAWIDPDCNPLTLYQSRLPSTVCALNISGFKRNTADNVEVVLPQAIDGFGNHQNGVQIGLSGQGNTSDWPDTYRWTLFIFGCPAQRGTGANCYNAGSLTAVPVSFSVPIIVRQRGAGEAQVTLSGTMMPHPGANNPLSAPAGWYTLQNLWRRDIFLSYANDTRWLVDPVLASPGFVRLYSAANTTHAVNVENGRLEVGPIQPHWDSALWALETPRGPGLVRIRNKWRSDWYIHVQRGAIEAGQAPADWDSSYWGMQPIQ